MIPGLGRSLGEGNDNPLQYSCLENPMDRGAWRAIVHGVARVGHDLATKPPPAGALLQRRSLNPGIEPRSPTLQADSLPAEPQEKPYVPRACNKHHYSWARLWLPSCPGLALKTQLWIPVPFISILFVAININLTIFS